MLRKASLILVLLLSACSKKGSSHVAGDPAAFLTSQKAFCTVEKDGVDKSNSVDRFEEVFVFRGRDLQIKGYDLDSNRRVQMIKAQPKIKDTEKATFRLEGKTLFLTADQERKVELVKVTRELDGKKANCFQLKGSVTTTHCPCVLPESK